MSLFGKSFEEKVSEALEQVKAKVPGVKSLSAGIEGKVVTLKGEVASREVKSQVMAEFNALVETENTINTVTIAGASPYAQTAPLPPKTVAPLEAAPSPGTDRIHLVAPGDTLSAIAKTYYGKASLYMKIFEANKDQLKDPNLIKVGQKLRIPP